jgi:hypothetical protein
MTDRALETRRLIREALDDPEVAWSIDSFGAIAEFSRSRDEARAVERGVGGGRIVTAKGALAVDLPDDAEAVAYEGLSGRADAWTQAVVVTVPAGSGESSACGTLTEIGPDDCALRAEDRGAVLFDMGLGTPNIDVCVRTADPTLIDVLRRETGTNVLTPDSAAMAAIKLASPVRVFRSAAGRIEVYQRIGSTRRNIATPEGPHTHVLPGLLSRRRTHAATVPVPEGRVPVLTVYPASPVTDAMGRRQPFDPARHDRFQAILARLAPDGYMAEKRRVAAAVAAGERPETHAPPASRTGRLAMRVALRQMVHTAPVAALEAWRRTWDTIEDRSDPHAA